MSAKPCLSDDRGHVALQRDILMRMDDCAERIHKMLDEWNMPDWERRDFDGLEARIGLLVHRRAISFNALAGIASLHDDEAGTLCPECGRRSPCQTKTIAAAVLRG